MYVNETNDLDNQINNKFDLRFKSNKAHLRQSGVYDYILRAEITQ